MRHRVGLSALVGGPIGLVAAIALLALAIGVMSGRGERPAGDLPPGSGRRPVLLIAGGCARSPCWPLLPPTAPTVWHVFMVVLLGAISLQQLESAVGETRVPALGEALEGVQAADPDRVDRRR